MLAPITALGLPALALVLGVIAAIALVVVLLWLLRGKPRKGSVDVRVFGLLHVSLNDSGCGCYSGPARKPHRNAKRK